LLPRWRLDAHAFEMLEIAPGDFTEIVLDEEAYGEARGVGRQRENVESYALW